MKSTPFATAVPKDDGLPFTRALSFNDRDYAVERHIPLTPPLFPRDKRTSSTAGCQETSLQPGIATFLSPAHPQSSSEADIQTQMMEVVDVWRRTFLFCWFSLLTPCQLSREFRRPLRLLCMKGLRTTRVVFLWRSTSSKNFRVRHLLATKPSRRCSIAGWVRAPEASRRRT